jgi:hypothetical protein
LCRTCTDSFARALALRHAAKEEELKPVKESDPLKESAPLVENESEDGEGTCTNQRTTIALVALVEFHS